MNALELNTVLLSEDRSCLEILDQTLLPGTVKVLRVEKIEDIYEAIKFLRVRGAPAIRPFYRPFWSRRSIWRLRGPRL